MVWDSSSGCALIPVPLQVLPGTLNGAQKVAVRCLALEESATRADFKRFDRQMRERCSRPQSCHLIQVVGAYLDWQVGSDCMLNCKICRVSFSGLAHC